jgi:ribosomal protein L36
MHVQASVKIKGDGDVLVRRQGRKKGKRIVRLYLINKKIKRRKTRQG